MRIFTTFKLKTQRTMRAFLKNLREKRSTMRVLRRQIVLPDGVFKKQKSKNHATMRVFTTFKLKTQRTMQPFRKNLREKRATMRVLGRKIALPCGIRPKTGCQQGWPRGPTKKKQIFTF